MKCHNCGKTLPIFAGVACVHCGEMPLPEPEPSNGGVRCAAHGSEALPSRARPTRAGWWWTRPAPDCLWRIVEITIADGGKVWMQDMGDEEPDILLDRPWWEWAGPVESPEPPVAPTRPNDQSSATAGGKGGT